jgi:hypothetical protein
LYSLANTNYVSGKMGIGVTAPTKSLEINGSIKLDTAGNGITYPDGTVQTTASVPGTGTITKVTAGTDLTGGGSSGGVTLNLDTTKVPTLAATTNTFTGTGGIVATHFSGDGTNVTNVNAAELGGLASSGFAQLAAANTFSNEQTVSGSNSVEMMLVSNDDTTDSGTLSLYAVNYGTDSTAISGEADNGTTSYGVHGTSNSGIGVFGQTSTGYGVYGQYVAGSVERGNCCFAGNAAIWADTNQEFVSGALLATSDSAPAAAFYSTSPLETLWAENDTPVATGVSAVVDAFGLGGSCSTYTNGNLTCTGSLTGVVRNSAQRSLEMYAVQATENWYEDAGSGQLRNGSATVQLDKDFSDLANTGMEYQVFPVPNGDCNGLYVTNKTNSSFEVRELHGGHANIAFDYRVIAKRKGMESLRMQDVSERVQAREALLQKRRQNGAAPVPGRPQPLHRNMQRSSLKESR